MAGAMIWMLTAMPAAAGDVVGRVRPRRDGAHVPGRRARPGARRPHRVRGVLRGRGVFVAGPGHRPRARLKDRVPAGQAAMSAAMAAMLFAAL